MNTCTPFCDSKNMQNSSFKTFFGYNYINYKYHNN